MNQFSSIFGQLLHIFPKSEFYAAVAETKSEKGAKGFTSWGQFVAMLFCQLGQARSLRDITGGLSSCLGKLKHLGINSAPSRSTLAYANEKRPWQLYEKVFHQLLCSKGGGIPDPVHKLLQADFLISTQAPDLQFFFLPNCSIHAFFHISFEELVIVADRFHDPVHLICASAH